MTPICMRCGLSRDDLDPSWIEAVSAGRRPTQIDTGEDFMFSGIYVGMETPTPCPRCADPRAPVALVSRHAAAVGAYIEALRWKR